MQTQKPILHYGDILELTIESTGFEGKSVARVDGFVVFVEGAVAGDRVKAKILRTKKKFAESKVVEILQPSPQRVDPRCSHFGVCGGCKWQHVDYTAQLQFKQQHVIDAIERIGGIKDPNILPIIGSEEEYFYRNKLEFSFSDKEWVVDKALMSDLSDSRHAGIPLNENSLALGFHVPQRWDKVLNVHECFLQSALSNDILNAVRAFALERNISSYSPTTESGYFRNLVIRDAKNTGDLMVNIVTYDDSAEIMTALTSELTKKFPEITTVINNVTQKKSQVAVGEYEKVYYGEGVIHEKIGKYLFQVSSNSFFQTNTRQAEKLYSIAKEFAALKPTDTVYDLYCGTGSIAVFISDAVKNVVGIELVESSIINARMNAELNLIKNCEFICGDLKDLLTQDTGWKEHHEQPDVIILDPPRSGMHPKAVDALGKMKVPKIVYVSCNPATLARDLQLLSAFGYHMEKVQPVDMFPHTYHIECVALITL